MLEFTKQEEVGDEAIAEAHANIDQLQKDSGEAPPQGHVLESTMQVLEGARMRHCKAPKARVMVRAEVITCMDAI